jgi:acyl-CoA synthetase (NDP forming)
MLEDDQIPSYVTPERAVNAINALIKYRKALEDKEKRRIG